jgi:hypothetical protein
MTYETLGKLALTGIILISIPIVYIVFLFIGVLIDEQIQKLPQWAKTTINLTLLGLFIIGLGVLIFHSL